MTVGRELYSYVKVDGEAHLALPTPALAHAKPHLFDARAETTIHRTQFEALAAVFDLSGFSAFCDRADLHQQALPFLREFIPWLFDQIISRSSKGVSGEHTLLWSRLPVWEKFTGDGMLIL